MMGLTRKQHEAFRFIADHLKETGSGPTMAEIAAALGLVATSGAKRLVDALIERGYLRRISRKARALEVVAQAQAIPLRPEIRREAEDFAKSHNISLETAVNEACRVYFERPA